MLFYTTSEHILWIWSKRFLCVLMHTSIIKIEFQFYMGYTMNNITQNYFNQRKGPVQSGLVLSVTCNWLAILMLYIHVFYSNILYVLNKKTHCKFKVTHSGIYVLLWFGSSNVFFIYVKSIKYNTYRCTIMNNQHSF